MDFLKITLKKHGDGYCENKIYTRFSKGHTQITYCVDNGDGTCAKLRVHHIAGGNPAEQGLANHS